MAGAVGAAEPRHDVITDEEFEFDRQVRNSPMAKALEAEASAREAERALLKRARDAQVERATRRMLLLDALQVAKAGCPEFAKPAQT